MGPQILRVWVDISNLKGQWNSCYIRFDLSGSRNGLVEEKEVEVKPFTVTVDSVFGPWELREVWETGGK